MAESPAPSLLGKRSRQSSGMLLEGLASEVSIKPSAMPPATPILKSRRLTVALTERIAQSPVLNKALVSCAALPPLSVKPRFLFGTLTSILESPRAPQSCASDIAVIGDTTSELIFPVFNWEIRFFKRDSNRLPIFKAHLLQICLSIFKFAAIERNFKLNHNLFGLLKLTELSTLLLNKRVLFMKRNKHC